ncbi:MAG: hypothetical protein FWG97_00595 [Deltaproteobacteria bacterium]|nr:hypothetical protein [Deltaproteobacteria bacterium]
MHKAEKPILSTWLVVIIGVMGLVLSWSTFPAQAEFDREPLLDIASGLNVLRDRLSYKLTLINPDNEDRKFYCSKPVYVFSNSGEFVTALEFYLIAATAEDQAKMKRLIQTLRQLDSSAKVYLKTLCNMCYRFPTEVGLAEKGREKRRIALEAVKLARTDLELQYNIALSQIAELRNSLLTQSPYAIINEEQSSGSESDDKNPSLIK